MKKVFLILAILAINGTLWAQVTDAEKDLKKQNADTTQGWKTGGIFSLAFTNVSLTNWAAGGQNTVSINGLSNMFATYRKGNSSWENYLNLGYGLLKQGKNANFMKTNDKIEFLSKYGQKATKHWYYSALVSFNSQFTAGYNYPDDSTVISNFLSPAYVLGAIGMDYKPNKSFSAFIAPFTSKITIVNDKQLSEAGAFGVEPGQTIRNEFGGYMRIFYTKDFTSKMSFQAKLDLFSNYLHNPQNIDVNLETLINIKLNKFISMIISTNLIYDDDIDIAYDSNDDGVIDGAGPRTQLKNILGVGLSYKF